MDAFVRFMIIIFSIAVFSVLVAFFLSSSFGFKGFFGKTATIIPIELEVSAHDSSSTVSSSWLVEKIQSAESDSEIDAIVLKISTPGGSAVSCMEVIEALENTTKPKVAWIRELAGSCGYMIASVSDHIIAHNFSLVGGLGVISSYIEFSGAMQRYGIDHIRLVSGSFKDTGSPYKNATQEEISMMQELHMFLKRECDLE